MTSSTMSIKDALKKTTGFYYIYHTFCSMLYRLHVVKYKPLNNAWRTANGLPPNDKEAPDPR